MKTKLSISALVLLAMISVHANAQSVVRDTLELDRALATSPATLLQGKVPGVRVSSFDGNVNGAYNTLIRGVNVLRGDSQPLWVVDGVIINSSLNDNKDAFFQYDEMSFTSSINAMSFLNPYDIESIQVIKDLSATAIYGSRAANGVIIVTTKLPKTEGLDITWNSNFGLAGAAGDITGARTAFSNNHTLSIASKKGGNAFRLSAFFRDVQGVVDNNFGKTGGFRANFETTANEIVWFGLSTNVAIGSLDEAAATSFYGQPSQTMTMRKESFFPKDSFDGWKKDFTDNAIDRRGTIGMYVQANITKSFNLRADIGVDLHNHNRYMWYGKGTSFGLDYNGAAALVGTTVFKYNAEVSLNWDKYLNTDHHIVWNAAFTVLGDNTKYSTLNGTDFFSHVLRERGISIANSPTILNKHDYMLNTPGGFVKLAYDYKNLFGIDAAVNAYTVKKYDDGKLNTFINANAFIDLKKAFFSDAYGVSSLKVRAGYGEAGNERFVAYGQYPYFTTGEYTVVPTELESFYSGFNRVRSDEFNAGVDMGFAGDRVTLYLGYYDKSTTDTFNAYSFGHQGESYFDWNERTDDFSQSTGIANKGIEAQVGADIIDNDGFKWNVSANVAFNTNSLTEVSANDTWGRTVGGGLVVNKNVVGNPVSAVYGTDGMIGNPIPKAFGGLGSTWSFGNWTVDLLADGAFGFDILNLNDMLFGNGGFENASAKYVEKGDYFRLSRLSFGYDIPVAGINWLDAVNVNLSALNLFTLTGYSGWNPEVNCFGSSCFTYGIDYGSYPTARGVVLGVCVKF